MYLAMRIFVGNTIPISTKTQTAETSTAETQATETPTNIAAPNTDCNHKGQYAGLT